MGTKSLGLPCKGSKSTIARQIVDCLPPATHFYDLFGGGGAIAQTAMLSGKYRFVHYNELDRVVCKGFQMFCNGDFADERRWISREDFHRLKTTDPYVNMVFSFCSNGRTYLYPTEFEFWKQAQHYAVLQHDFRLLDDMGIHMIRYSRPAVRARMAEYLSLYAQWLRTKRPDLQVDFERIRSMPAVTYISLDTETRLNRLKAGGGVLREIIVTNCDYRELSFETDSVIYCDPPYKDTKGFCTNSTKVQKFDHDAFYAFVRGRKNCFISELTMPEGFKAIKSIPKRILINQPPGNGKYQKTRDECVFVPEG